MIELLPFKPVNLHNEAIVPIPIYIRPYYPSSTSMVDDSEIHKEPDNGNLVINESFVNETIESIEATTSIHVSTSRHVEDTKSRQTTEMQLIAPNSKFYTSPQVEIDLDNGKVLIVLI